MDGSFEFDENVSLQEKQYQIIETATVKLVKLLKDTVAVADKMLLENLIENLAVLCDYADFIRAEQARFKPFLRMTVRLSEFSPFRGVTHDQIFEDLKKELLEVEANERKTTPVSDQPPFA